MRQLQPIVEGHTMDSEEDRKPDNQWNASNAFYKKHEIITRAEFYKEATYERKTGGHCEHIAPYRILKIEVKSLVVDHM